MNITKQADGNKLILFLDGKLDTVTAPQLDAELKAAFEEYDTVEINMEKLVYISSAGLRVMHSTHKRVRASKTMLISHATGTVLDIFESTGFSAFLNLMGLMKVVGNLYQAMKLEKIMVGTISLTQNTRIKLGGSRGQCICL